MLLLTPYAPHLAEELWERLGREPLAGNQEWPSFQEELTRDEQINLVFQINGKVRAQVEADSGITPQEMKEMASLPPADTGADRGKTDSQGHTGSGETREHRRKLTQGERLLWQATA